MFTEPKSSSPESGDAEINQRFADKFAQEPNLNFLTELFDALPGLRLHLVGGMVRDTIIKAPTSKDYDFVAGKIKIEKLIETLNSLGRVDLVGRNFGVLKFLPNNSTLTEPIDIALPRTEFAMGTGGYRDFQAQADPELPVEQDLSRRDLTINAIAWDVNNKQIVDPYNGRQDIENKIIRCVGRPADRFQEDYSRMLRAIRFACRFDFEIEPQTWAAMQDLIPHLNDTRKNQAGKEERVVPMETITKEIFKSLKANPAKALALLTGCGALAALLPELEQTRIEQPAQWRELEAKIAHLDSPEFRERFPRWHIKPDFIFGLLIERLGFDRLKPAAAQNSLNNIASRFRLTAVEKQKLNAMTAQRQLLNQPDGASKVLQEKLLFGDNGNSILMAAYLDSINPDNSAAANDFQILWDNYQELLKLADAGGELPNHLLTGEQIKQALHQAMPQFKAKQHGRLIGQAKDAIREAQLAGEISTGREAEKLIAATDWT